MTDYFPWNLLKKGENWLLSYLKPATFYTKMILNAINIFSLYLWCIVSFCQHTFKIRCHKISLKIFRSTVELFKLINQLTKTTENIMPKYVIITTADFLCVEWAKTELKNLLLLSLISDHVIFSWTFWFCLSEFGHVFLLREPLFGKIRRFSHWLACFESWNYEIMKLFRNPLLFNTYSMKDISLRPGAPIFVSEQAHILIYPWEVLQHLHFF